MTGFAIVCYTIAALAALAFVILVLSSPAVNGQLDVSARKKSLFVIAGIGLATAIAGTGYDYIENNFPRGGFADERFTIIGFTSDVEAKQFAADVSEIIDAEIGVESLHRPPETSRFLLGDLRESGVMLWGSIDLYESSDETSSPGVQISFQWTIPDGSGDEFEPERQRLFNAIARRVQTNPDLTATLSTPR